MSIWLNSHHNVELFLHYRLVGHSAWLHSACICFTDNFPAGILKSDKMRSAQSNNWLWAVFSGKLTKLFLAALCGHRMFIQISLICYERGRFTDHLFSCDGGPPSSGPHVLDVFLSSLFFSSFCRFDSLPTFMLHEPVTEFLTEFLSCSCRLCAWWRWRGQRWMTGWSKMGTGGFSTFTVCSSCCAWWRL